MERHGQEVHFETDEARGASSPNIVRWILAISLFAAIALLSVIWITGAATQGPVESEGTAEGRARVTQDYGSGGGVLPSQAEDSAAQPSAATGDQGADTAPAGETAAN